jgi:predicted transcriptional regulator
MATKDRRTLTVTVMSIDDMKKRTLAAASGKRLSPVYAFATRELLWKFMNKKKEDILHALTDGGPMSIRAIARAVGRDVKAVHGDVHEMLKARMISKNEEGLIEFLFDAVRVEYDVIEAA